MLFKYLILISFLNLVLSEAFALVCFENNNTIKYENVFDSCCKKEHSDLFIQSKSSDPAIDRITDDCCVDYDHNYTYVPEQYLLNFKCKDFRPTDIASTKFATQYSYYDCQKINSVNFYNLHQLRTTVIRI